MKRNIFPLISLLLGIGVVFFGIMDSGGNVMMFISVSSLLIVLGGSLAALAIIFSLDDLKKIPKLFGVLLSKPDYDLVQLVELFEHLSQKARRDGVLALESDVDEIEDEFFKKGLQLVIDGSEADEIKDILMTEIEVMESRHTHNQSIIAKWGTLAPGFGMIGTVIGLIVMLGDLSTDPQALGAGMATALITTFYGSFFSNLFFEPVAENLALKTVDEITFKEFVLEGIIMIQNGVSPRVIKDKMMMYLSPEQKAKMNESQSQE